MRQLQLKWIHIIYMILQTTLYIIYLESKIWGLDKKNPDLVKIFETVIVKSYLSYYLWHMQV